MALEAVETLYHLGTPGFEDYLQYKCHRIRVVQGQVLGLTRHP
jgi:hypothetical protein